MATTRNAVVIGGFASLFLLDIHSRVGVHPILAGDPRAVAECDITVTFAPASTGGRNATLIVSDNASGRPHTAGLTGTGSSR